MLRHSDIPALHVLVQAWRSLHDAGTRGWKVRETYLGDCLLAYFGGISTARFKMNNGSSDIHVVQIEYSGEWFELKNTEKKKWRLRLSPLSRPQLFSLFFLCAYRVFSHDVTAAILVSQNNETAALSVSQTNPVGFELFSYANTFFCSRKFP